MNGVILPGVMGERVLAAIEEKVRREGLVPVGYRITGAGYVWIAEAFQKMSFLEHPDLATQYPDGVWRTCWAMRNAIREIYFSPSTTQEYRIQKAVEDALEYAMLTIHYGLPVH